MIFEPCDNITHCVTTIYRPDALRKIGGYWFPGRDDEDVVIKRDQLGENITITIEASDICSEEKGCTEDEVYTINLRFEEIIEGSWYD